MMIIQEKITYYIKYIVKKIINIICNYLIIIMAYKSNRLGLIIVLPERVDFLSMFKFKLGCS